MKHRAITTLTAAALMVLASSTAWAGGWAMTSLDSTPGELRAGETYEIGYTILQHGVRPVVVDHTEIRLHGPWKGDVHVFEGEPRGPEGHYVATITIPEAGEYRWEVSQGPFGHQDLGSFPAGEAIPAQTTGVIDALRTALPIAALLSAAFVAWQALSLRRLRLAADAA